MEQLVTLVIILHNRHQNLDRLLKYYLDVKMAIVIADSSAMPHHFAHIHTNWQHFYTPGVSYTEKIEITLARIQTPFVVLCADDDFTVPESILRCVEFLDKHDDYVAAQGNCLRYFNDTVGTGRIKFSSLYDIQPFVEQEAPLVRLEKMFNPYKSILYAVHRTDSLRRAFHRAGPVIRNLFLNEYLTAIVPSMAGKLKDFSFLYQVRQYAEDSDDKITDNLDTIIFNEKYRDEWKAFVSLCAENAAAATHLSEAVIEPQIKIRLSDFASHMMSARHIPLSLRKRIGSVVNRVPLLGPGLVSLNRKTENKKDLKKALRTGYDHRVLSAIRAVLQDG